MPLVIVTGYPTSGKTTRAKQLRDHLERRARAEGKEYRLHLISDQTLSISRAVYDLSAPAGAHVRSANASEKDARAALYAAVKRALSDRDVVILDGLNYIKGWRYQLHCEAKALRTPSCLLQVGCDPDRCRQVNEERLAKRAKQQGTAASCEPGGDSAPASDPTATTNPTTDNDDDDDDDYTNPEAPYQPANWENLVFRYEEPNPMTRWDSPLFTVVWDDDEAQAGRAFDGVWDAVAGEARKLIRPNQATVQRSRDAGADYLYVLDRETQDVVRRVLDQQADDGGNDVTIPRAGGGGGDGGGNDDDNNNNDTLVVELPAGKKVGLPQLQRLRRAFVGLNRGGIGLESVGNMGPVRIRESFVRYLNDAFENDG